MKQNNRDCKIVQDLLPNYIENLTDEVTNEYIEEHIAHCEECAQVLKDMNGDLKLEQINQDHEIKYLEGIRRRVIKIIALVALVIIVIAGCVVGYVYNKSKIQVNNYTFMIATYIVENKEEIENGSLYGTLIGVFNEKNICIGVREVEKYDENKMQIISGIKDFCSNLMILNDELHYNTNIWNGLAKDEVKERWTTYYKIDKLEEI